MSRPLGATEKCKAVLAIWTERRRVSEICWYLAVAKPRYRWNAGRSRRWRRMLLGLENSSRQEKCPAMNGRVEEVLPDCQSSLPEENDGQEQTNTEPAGAESGGRPQAGRNHFQGKKRPLQRHGRGLRAWRLTISGRIRDLQQ